MKQSFFQDAFATGKTGVWAFVRKDGKPFDGKTRCHGYGIIRYGEGSVYTGEIYFDGKSYNKIGAGQQDFCRSTIGLIDPNINERMDKYVGAFDYRHGDWIYGNGVLYYRDSQGNPSHFLKGFFLGVDKIKDYQGRFDYSKLQEGYSPEMEFDYSPRLALFRRELSKAKEVGKVDTLFLGDSYLEFWNYDQFTSRTFYEVFPHALNLGLGGTTYANWFTYLPLLDKKLSPKTIIVNLGFNDIHASTKPEEVLADFEKFHSILTRIYPKAHIVYLTVVHCPVFLEAPYFAKERRYNQLFRKKCEEKKIAYLDSEKAFDEKRKAANGQDYRTLFWQDEIHPSEKGYDVLEGLIKQSHE